MKGLREPTAGVVETGYLSCLSEEADYIAQLVKGIGFESSG
jgi:hypothetical protein